MIALFAIALHLTPTSVARVVPPPYYEGRDGFRSCLQASERLVSHAREICSRWEEDPVALNRCALRAGILSKGYCLDAFLAGVGIPAVVVSAHEHFLGGVSGMRTAFEQWTEAGSTRDRALVAAAMDGLRQTRELARREGRGLFLVECMKRVEQDSAWSCRQSGHIGPDGKKKKTSRECVALWLNDRAQASTTFPIPTSFPISSARWATMTVMTTAREGELRECEARSADWYQRIFPDEVQRVGR